ncbi:MAG: hypothetical protein E7374_01280 [Clostridiales bacterium]|nr:hypothetical protein [Clostridiales bacterium]
MNIGIDFDGVLFDSESMYRAYSVIYNLKKYNGKDEIDSEELKFQDRYSWTNEDCEYFLSKHTKDFEQKAPLMPIAKELINILSKKHKIFAITARNTKESIATTNKRLKKEKIKFDKVIYGASSKLNICKELKIDIMIDDYSNTVETLANEGIKCFYYKDLVEKDCKHKNIKEVKNWGEIALEMYKMGIISDDDLNCIYCELN